MVEHCTVAKVRTKRFVRCAKQCAVVAFVYRTTCLSTNASFIMNVWSGGLLPGCHHGAPRHIPHYSVLNFWWKNNSARSSCLRVLRFSPVGICLPYSKFLHLASTIHKLDSLEHSYINNITNNNNNKLI